MDYFKINYNKLENMTHIKFNKFIILIFLILFIMIIISMKIKIFQKFECYGIYQNGYLTINLNNKLSDRLKVSNYLKFNNQIINFEIEKYGEYEIIDNEVYQEITIIIEEKFYDNEVGLVEFYYDEISVFKYILKLFK